MFLKKKFLLSSIIFKLGRFNALGKREEGRKQQTIGIEIFRIMGTCLKKIG